MSDIMSAIADDILEYVSLCEHFGEKIVCDKQGVDPYCLHAKQLQDRAHKEWLARRDAEEKKSKKANRKKR